MKRMVAATLVSLTNRNYRLYFFGQMVSTVGTWAQKIALPWLVLELTGSSTALGLAVGLQAVPLLLLGPWAGLLADRFDKRRILVITSCAAILPAAAIGLVSATGHATVWIVMCAAAVTGVIEAIDKPARQSFVIEMVGPQHLVNAITLNSIIFSVGRLVGPALAGLLIVTVGLPMTFFVNAASFVGVLLALLAMRRAELHPAPRTVRSKGQLVEGFRYVREQPNLLAPLILLTVTGLLAWEFTVTIPLLAHDAFAGDAQLVGWMFSAMGAGALLGSLALAGVLKATNAGLIVASLTFAILLGAVALVPSLPLSLVLLVLLGGAGMIYRAITNSLAQLRAAPGMRGRTVSLYMMAVGGTSPVSAPLLGWLCEFLGIRATLLIGAGGSAVTAIAVLLYLRARNRGGIEGVSDRVGDDPTAQPSGEEHARPTPVDEEAAPPRSVLRPARQASRRDWVRR